MINNYTYQTLPFYDDVDKQNFKQKWLYDDLCSSFLICPQNRLIPFQLSRPTKYTTIQSILLCSYNGNVISDILADIPINDIKITSAGTNDYITYFGNKDLTNDLPCGLYYLVVFDYDRHWYSEVFKVDCFDFSTKRGIIPVDGNTPTPSGDLIASSGSKLIFSE